MKYLSTHMASPVPSFMPLLVASYVTDFSDDNESVEDSVYRPSPYVSEGDEMDDSVVNLSRKGVSVSGMRKKWKNVSGSGCVGTSNIVEVQNNDGDGISEQEEFIVSGNVRHWETYSQGMQSEPHVGPQLEKLTSDGERNSYHSEELKASVSLEHVSKLK
ncbi:type II toxin-antitoxin system HipA family toxin [Sesbania bispinosa]|nr:type II toxin-antitoxin system HipA family toxin [Sesbania bispinosa]